MTKSILGRRAVLGLLLASVPFAARAQGNLLDQGKNLMGTFGKPGSGTGGSGASSLTAGEIGGGLKEALTVASRLVTKRLGATDGYFKDTAVRIPLPGPVEQIAGPLRSLGAAGLIDDLHLKMDRAAEQAAPKALDIFTGAISKMTISDAQGILNGPKDAATQYFRRTTSGDLTKAFRPIVDNSLSSVGAVGAYNSVKSRGSSVPLAGNSLSSFDLTDFTVGKALDGLFHYVAVEENAIRTNPAARTTDLLKKVFS